MYSPPKGKNGVYFTRDLNETNYNNGKWLLGFYWRASVISKAPYYPLTNFDGMINFLNSNYPTYIESLGELMKTIDQDKLKAAMEATAKKGYTDYPRPAYFAQAIIDKTGYTLTAKVGDVIQAVGDSVMDIGKFAFFASVAGLLFVGYIEFGPVLKAMFKQAKKV